MENTTIQIKTAEDMFTEAFKETDFKLIDTEYYRNSIQFNCIDCRIFDGEFEGSEYFIRICNMGSIIIGRIGKEDSKSYAHRLSKHQMLTLLNNYERFFGKEKGEEYAKVY